MGTLLHASLSRLVRDPAFRGAALLTVLFSGFVCYANYNPVVQASDWHLHLEDVYFTALVLEGLLFAGCISLMQGTGFEQGTLRNLFVAGYTRVEIYSSAWLTAWVSAAAVIVLHGVVTVPLGLWLFGECTIPGELASCVPLILLGGVSFASVFTAISMNCGSRGTSAVWCMGLTLLLMQVPDPAQWNIFPKLVEFVRDLNPQGQLMQMYSMEFEKLWYWAGLSVALSAAVSVIGCRSFMKKEIS